MHALIVHCHPEARSFNGALKDVAVETLRRLGHTVEVVDNPSVRGMIQKVRHLVRVG